MKKTKKRFISSSKIFIYKGNHGFTLIELLVGMGVVLLISAAIAGVIYSFSNVADFIYSRINSQSEINEIFSKFLNELRSAVTSANGGYAIQYASTSSLVFFSNTIGDSAAERIRYFIDANSLKRGLIMASGSPAVYDVSTETIGTLVPNISVASSGIFSYFGSGSDASSTPLSYPLDISDIRVIKINLLVVETTKGVTSTRSFTSSVAPRSLLY